MKVNKEVNRIRKEMENENYETLFKNVAGVVQERAEAVGRDLELCHKRAVIHSISARMKNPDSIYKKLVKKGLNPTITAARQELQTYSVSESWSCTWTTFTRQPDC